MVENSGPEIKNAGKTVMTLGMILSLFAGFVIMAIPNWGFVVGIVYMIAGCFGAWLIGLILKGFGEIVDNSYHMRLAQEGKKAPDQKTPDAGPAPAARSAAPQPEVQTEPVRKPARRERLCPGCGMPGLSADTFCYICGTRLEP